MDHYLEIAIEAVREASHICQQVQAQLISEDTLIKKDRSPVTVADFASQAVVCHILHEHFPQIAIVGEEDAQNLRRAENKELLAKIQTFLTDWSASDILDSIDLGNGQPGGLFWTLDPIDGTKGFLRGQQYAVALSLIENGQPVLGVLGCPNLPYEDEQEQGTLAWAVNGRGAFIRQMEGAKSKALHVAQSGDEGEVRFLESVEAGHANHGLQGAVMDAFGRRAQSVRYDSQVKYAVLARGEADVYLRLPNPSQPEYREKIWDHAAGVAIVREAGGQVSDMFGKDLDFSQGKKLLNNQGVIATNGSLHEMIVETIKKAQ